MNELTIILEDELVTTLPIKEVERIVLSWRELPELTFDDLLRTLFAAAQVLDKSAVN